MERSPGAGAAPREICNSFVALPIKRRGLPGLPLARSAVWTPLEHLSISSFVALSR
jgi:hypothetical protein